MAKLRVSTEFLLAQMFVEVNPPPLVEIVGAAYDPVSRIIELEIVGADVPDVDRVQGIFTVQPRQVTVKFVPDEPVVPGTPLKI